jgi:hypothetical protein
VSAPEPSIRTILAVLFIVSRGEAKLHCLV